MALRVVLASQNKDKGREFKDLFKSGPITVLQDVVKITVLETGNTFHENAHLKAFSYFEKLKVPTISDDSGLVVDALPDELGVHSARFGGEGLSYQERSNLLLKKMEGVENRDAYFISVLCFYLSPKEVFFFEGRLNGTIGFDLKGDKGFGYDPLFIPRGQDNTLAQLPDWKMENSHRAQAAQMALKFFKENQNS